MTYIISVANEKGGVAKTTSVTSLGAALVEAGLEVLLVDLDGQDNLSLVMGFEINRQKPSMVNVLLESLPAAGAVVNTAITKLDVIPSSGEMALAERFMPIRQGYEMTLAKSLREAGWYYD